MTPQQISGHVDENHQLSAIVPQSIPPGPVSLIVLPATGEDDAGGHWQTGISHQWHDDLADERQDIYTLEDGDAVDES